MTKNTLIVTFDDAALKKISSDSLCISKKVNGVFNVVFDNAAMHPAVGQKKLLKNNTFRFTTDYRVYFTQSYENDALINVATDPKEIAIGQYVQWNTNDLSDAGAADTKLLSTTDAKTSFVIKNAPSQYRVAVQASTGKDWSTIFVDPNDHMAGSTITLTPKNEYLLYWFNVTDTEYIHEVVESDQNFKFSFPPGDSTKKIRFGYTNPDAPIDGEEQFAFHHVE